MSYAQISLRPDITSAEQRRRVSAPGMRTFTAIADLWRLSELERRIILGHQPKSTVHSWMTKARTHQALTLNFDVLIRFSLILGIYRALRILYTTEEAGIEWLRKPDTSPTFGGQTPMALVTSGSQDALFQVRRFLDGARGGLHLAPNEIDQNSTPYTDADIRWS